MAILIEHRFKGLEAIVILATNYPPKFTMVQRMGKTKPAMEKCELFQTHLDE
jgi:hypothetical protein